MRALLVALTLLAAVLAAAGVAALVVERRLATLAPGGMEVAALHYNPFSGRLALQGVRGHDAAGRELFRADRVTARLNPLRLLLRPLALSEARVTAPRLTLRAEPGFDLAGLAAGLGAAPAAATSLPVRIEDLVIADGDIVVEGGGEGGAPLLARDLDVRLSRVTTAVAQGDVAFAVEMAVYGTTVHVTGLPRGASYAIHVRARGLDVADLVRDFPVAALAGLQRGRAEIDAELLLVGGRLLASGYARVADVVLTLPMPGRPQLRAATLAAVVEKFDLTSGGGRITRLDLGAPSLSLPAATAAVTLAGLLAPLQSRADLLLRRVAVTGGTLVLEGPGGVRLERVQLTAAAPERRGDGSWIVSARAGVGADAEVALDGALTRDLRSLDAEARMQRVALGPWRELMGAPVEWDARLSFHGRLQAAVQEGETAVTVAGQAVLADVGAGHDGFRADRIALGIRRLQWPAAAAVVDRIVLTRLGIDRIVPYDTPAEAGVPLEGLLAAIEDAARTTPEP